MSRLHWIEIPTPGRLAIAARPRSDDWLEDDIADWKRGGINVVLSLLEKDEVSELKLEREAELCRVLGMEFRSFPIPDRGVPSAMEDAKQLAHSIAGNIAGGSTVAIHCRAGIGRSSIIAACALICLGIDAERALNLDQGGARIDRAGYRRAAPMGDRV